MLQISTATVHKIETTSDHGLKITLYTRELPEAEVVALFLAKSCGDEGICIDVVASDELKSPSQRLRNVIYIHWKNGPQTKTFEIYYRETMEYLIEKFKETFN